MDCPPGVAFIGLSGSHYIYIYNALIGLIEPIRGARFDMHASRVGWLLVHINLQWSACQHLIHSGGKATCKETCDQA